MNLQPDKIIAHHSFTEDSETLSWGPVRTDHMARGYFDIGYHAGIENIRGDYECLFGRPVTMMGAHTRGQNTRSLGFLFMGNFDIAPPPLEMLEVAAHRVIVPWLIQFDLDVDHIFAHRDFADYKSCCGKEFSIERLRYVCQKELSRG